MRKTVIAAFAAAALIGLAAPAASASPAHPPAHAGHACKGFAKAEPKMTRLLASIRRHPHPGSRHDARKLRGYARRLGHLAAHGSGDVAADLATAAPAISFTGHLIGLGVPGSGPTISMWAGIDLQLARDIGADCAA